MSTKDATRRRGARAALVLAVLLATIAGAVGPAGAAEADTPPTPAPEAQPDPRIVGGTLAAPGEFPSQVALVDRGATPSNGQFCGGTVIDRSWVLTAGHCVTTDSGGVYPPSAMDILVGTTDLRFGGTRIRVVEIRRHPSFHQRTLRSDVALLRLDRPVPAGTPIQALAGTGTDPAEGADVVTAGWGDLGNGSYPEQLRKVTLDFQTASTCRNATDEEYDAASMVCAWRSGKSGCYGDSGGPLYENRDGTLVQVGVVSWGYTCGNTVSVFARVSALSTWIRWQVRYGPQPNANAFVKRQYVDLFGRQPTNAELFYGVAALEDGQSTAAFVAGLLDGSAYGRKTGGVIRLYRAIFLRSPETGGLAYWVREANRGVSLKRIADLMVRAPEFVELYGQLSNGDFVDLVYDNVLHRTPSERDRTYWVGELDSGRRSRGEVMVGFSESPEYKTAEAALVRVFGAFHGLVRRAPSSSETATWSDDSTGAIATFLLKSYSYAARF